MTGAVLLDASSATDLERAGRLLAGGAVVAIPTETVYGLAADATNPIAVARVFEAKRRPSFDPLIVHFASAGDVWAMCPLAPPLARRLAERFWPGPLTILVPRPEAIPLVVTAGLELVGVRVPGHPAARALIASAGVPLAAPSANLFGALSPTTAAAVFEGLGSRIDAVVDGGACTVGLESTVVRVVDDSTVEVLRPGGVPNEALRAIGLDVVDGVRVLERPLAPGQLARHYATHTPLRLVAAPDGRRGAALLVVSGRVDAPGYERVVELSPEGDLRIAAANLFISLRALDAARLDTIDVIACEPVGLGAAIVDRLSRAAVREEL